MICPLKDFFLTTELFCPLAFHPQSCRKKKKSLISLKLLLSNAGESYTSMNTYITTNS